MDQPRILYCHCAYAQVLPKSEKEAVLRRLQESGVAFDAVDDLCQLSARRDPLLKELAKRDGLKIVACYPRAIKWLFDAAGAPLSEADSKVYNLRVSTADEIIPSLLENTSTPVAVPKLNPSASSDQTTAPPAPTATRAAPGPWFPVIDFGRCTQCMQCLSFCLFGVYGIDEQRRIQVQQPESCKTNCPACSRVCPEAAIIFPKYKNGPINGEPINSADVQREKIKVDISALLGGEVYHLLRERSARAKSRFSKERDANQALAERQKCLAQLMQTADIPPEVLMALPSPEEIQWRAQEAMAKAQAALQGRSLPEQPQ